jgi:tRNA G18 (ribose-2'-O)-methylase SpoU
VSWSYAPTAVEAIKRIKKQEARIKVFAVEQDDRSIPYDKADYSFPIALVVGHESDGVSKEVLEIVDQIVELPMWGVNKSLNVMVSLGIVLYQAMATVDPK